MNEVLLSSSNQEWRTPPALFARLDAEFHFTLDAAASEKNHLVERYLTAEEDALKADWLDHVVWCNPPYGRGLIRWVKKFWTAASTGATVVALLPARTDTAYFHSYVWRADEVRFIRGRVHFLGEEGEEMGPSPMPTMVVVWHPSKGRVGPRINRHVSFSTMTTDGALE